MLPIICRYISILTISFSLAVIPRACFAQADTTDSDTTEVNVRKKIKATQHQFCAGFDIFRPVMNALLKDTSGRSYGYEIEANYYVRNEYYLAAEAGWGGSEVRYADLNYNTNNSFLRLGFNKSVLARDKPDDWDMMFIGFRGAVAHIVRSDATYTITDPIWGKVTGVLHPQPSFDAVWLEVNGGVRLEVVKHLMVGWNARAKFLMNGKSKFFKDLTPLYVAGYGKGDKNSSFDLNMYVSYALRWKKKNDLPVIDTVLKPLVKPGAGSDSLKVIKEAPKKEK